MGRMERLCDTAGENVFIWASVGLFQARAARQFAKVVGQLEFWDVFLPNSFFSVSWKTHQPGAIEQSLNEYFENASLHGRYQEFNERGLSYTCVS